MSNREERQDTRAPGGKDRSITTIFDLNGTDRLDDHGHIETIRFEVVTSNYNNVNRSYVRRMTCANGMTRQTVEIGARAEAGRPGELATPTPRFNRAALTAQHAAFLATIEADLPPVIEWALRARPRYVVTYTNGDYRVTALSTNSHAAAVARVTLLTARTPGSTATILDTDEEALATV